MRLCMYYPSLRVTGLGVGVHLTLFKSLSFPVVFVPSHPAVCCIACARLTAAVPIAVRSNNRLAAGVKLPAASALLGVQDGGGIDPFLAGVAMLFKFFGVRAVGPPSNIAFARRLLAALAESL